MTHYHHRHGPYIRAVAAALEDAGFNVITWTTHGSTGWLTERKQQAS